MTLLLHLRNANLANKLYDYNYSITTELITYHTVIKLVLVVIMDLKSG